MNPTIEENRDIRMWVETGKMNQEEIEIPLEWSVETGLAIADQLLTSGDTEQAPSSFAVLSGFLTSAANNKPSLAKRLSSQVKKFKTSAKAAEKKLKADLVSIAVGIPWGVSIDLSWDI